MLTNGEFFGFLMANIFWTFIFFGALLGGLMGSFIVWVGELIDVIVGLAICAFLVAFGAAGLALMIGRVWPTWM